MKNNRSLVDHTALIKKYNLSTNPPAPNSLFWKMWNDSKDIAQHALETEFVQSIKKGNLDPTCYGAFSVSDIYYCTNGARDYGIAANRATDAILRDYLLTKQYSYQKYNKTLCTTWSLSGPQSIVPKPVALSYSRFETSVATGTIQNSDACDPIFALVVMIPCEYLWAWLAIQLTPSFAGNIYASWITNNNSPSGAYAMGNFLQSYITKHRLDEDLASLLYRTAMEYEYKNFQSATEVALAAGQAI